VPTGAASAPPAAELVEMIESLLDATAAYRAPLAVAGQRAELALPPKARPSSSSPRWARRDAEAVKRIARGSRAHRLEARLRNQPAGGGWTQFDCGRNGPVTAIVRANR